MLGHVFMSCAKFSTALLHPNTSLNQSLKASLYGALKAQQVATCLWKCNCIEQPTSSKVYPRHLAKLSRSGRDRLCSYLVITHKSVNIKQSDLISSSLSFISLPENGI